MIHILWKILRFLLFRLEPEAAHRLTVQMIQAGQRLSPRGLAVISGASRVFPIPQLETQPLPQVFGMTFLSRVGLAAGFDKDGELLEALPHLGFGFVEIGTVTPRPQPGNPQPRLFREPKTRALFNCMGFNGAGAKLVSQNLRAARPLLPLHFRVGVNLGKNKETSLEDAAADYRKAAEYFEDLADYLVINVSSPNTPGLRSLQSAQFLLPIVDQVTAVIAKWSRKPPLLLKLAPEIRGDELISLMKAIEGDGNGGQSPVIDGWVLTNTLGGTKMVGPTILSGGRSGGPLSGLSRQSLIEAKQASRLPIISVGGVTTDQEAVERRKLGADLIQIYTGWIYGGPTFPVQASVAVSDFDFAKNAQK